MPNIMIIKNEKFWNELCTVCKNPRKECLAQADDYNLYLSAKPHTNENTNALPIVLDHPGNCHD